METGSICCVFLEVLVNSISFMAKWCAKYVGLRVGLASELLDPVC